MRVCTHPCTLGHNDKCTSQCELPPKSLKATDKGSEKYVSPAVPQLKSHTWGLRRGAGRQVWERQHAGKDTPRSVPFALQASVQDAVAASVRKDRLVAGLACWLEFSSLGLLLPGGFE